MSHPKNPSPAAPSSPGSATGAASEPQAKDKGRRALLKDKPDAPEPPAKPPAPPRAAARQAAAAQKRPGAARPLTPGVFFTICAVLFVMLAGAVGTAVWFYENRIVPELQAGGARPAAPVSAPAVAVDTAPLQSALERSNAQIAELQKQLDAQREERERTQGRLQEMADRMALVIQQSSFTPKPATASQPDPGTGQMATLLPTVSPSTSELILLKERNRLTGFADRAIATGNRESLQRLVEVIMDPEQKNLAYAAQAEFKRVQAYYEISSSIDPGYKLPVQELLKSDSVRTEADLSGEQLQKIMLDVSQPWEARLRCAYLLRAGTAPGTDEALLKVIREDPSLDVAKQAQTSFERRVGRRFRLFDIPAIEAWWQAQGTGKSTPVPMKDPERQP